MEAARSLLAARGTGGEVAWTADLAEIVARGGLRAHGPCHADEVPAPRGLLAPRVARRVAARHGEAPAPRSPNLPE